jgi:hypothetical protein
MKPWVSGLLGAGMGAIGGVEGRYAEERKQDDAMEIERYRSEKAMEAQQLRNEGMLNVAKVQADGKTSPVSDSDKKHAMNYFVMDSRRMLVEKGMVPAGYPMDDVQGIIEGLNRKMAEIPEGDPRRSEYSAMIDKIQGAAATIWQAEVAGQLDPIWSGGLLGLGSPPPAVAPAENVVAPENPNQKYLTGFEDFSVTKREKVK